MTKFMHDETVKQKRWHRSSKKIKVIDITFTVGNNVHELKGEQ